MKGVEEDLKKIAREADRVDKSRADSLNALMKHPGWAVYWGLVQAQVQNHADQILAPARSVDEMIALEGVKGAMRGLLLAVGLPTAIIEQMKELRRVDEEEGT